LRNIVCSSGITPSTSVCEIELHFGEGARGRRAEESLRDRIERRVHEVVRRRVAHVDDRDQRFNVDESLVGIALRETFIGSEIGDDMQPLSVAGCASDE